MNLKYKLGQYLPDGVREYLSKTKLVIVLYSPKPMLTFKYIYKMLFSNEIKLSFKQRKQVLQRFFDIEKHVECGHSFDEVLITSYKILTLPDNVEGAILEAGSFKGGGTTKLSIVAKLTGRKLYVFDSFEGLPDNDEVKAETDMGYNCEFKGGDYAGSLEYVKDKVKKYGEIEACEFVKGYYDTTMVDFKDKLAVVFCDVDLELSNKTCLKYLYPLIQKGGYFFSQDAHIPLIQELFRNRVFWENEVKVLETPKFRNYTKRYGYFRK